MIEVTEHTLDIDAILQSKMGDKAKRVPRFLVNWLKKIMHQEELNEFLWMARDKQGTPWLKAATDFLSMKIVVKGRENLPAKDDGRQYTFVSNHPLGGIDGIALGAIIGETYDDNFRYLVNDLLMNLPGLAPLCIPINKTGKQSRDFPAMVEAGFKSDHHMLMFPAGLCSRKMNGEIHDLPWTKTFITKSIQSQRDVVPIYFEGRNSERFYRIANICKALKLKVNIAMLFLSDEMFRNKGKTFEVHIGKPIPYQTFDKSKTPMEWAKYVQDEVYKLR
ncbi:MAG: glycerol acyltransferase [Prevotella sp.]|nr:glycerol acyltransferase [Candidatus Prevotella equi]